jgi:hypothetical protein
MSQCALQPVEDFFGLHIMAHWQPSSLRSWGISTLVCYASNICLVSVFHVWSGHDHDYYFMWMAFLPDNFMSLYVKTLLFYFSIDYFLIKNVFTGVMTTKIQSRIKSFRTQVITILLRATHYWTVWSSGGFWKNSGILSAVHLWKMSRLS